jgi:hypothetical protein
MTSAWDSPSGFSAETSNPSLLSLPNTVDNG